MKPIVLATDGSPSAAEATLRAVELAHSLGAPLIAVSVEHVTVPSYGYYGYAQILGELNKIEREHVEATLNQAKAIATEAHVPCDTVASSGLVVDEICKVARIRDAQMIVIGAHGWGPMRRMLHGSVSTAVLHEAPCPVLVVRAGPEPIRADPRQLEAASVR